MKKEECAKNPVDYSTGLSYGAGDEARTRYLHLGKVALYRMSYTRICRNHYTHNPCICQVLF